MDKKKIQKALKKGCLADAAYEVGYGKPPESKQFKKGASGNPNGRPKGSKNKTRPIGGDVFREKFLEEASRIINVQVGGETVALSMGDAIFRSYFATAAKGNTRAQKHFMVTYATALQAERQEEIDFYKAAVDYKERWTEILYERKQAGVRGRDPVPHPDDIIIDPTNGSVEFRGPITQEEKEILDFYIDRKKAFEKEVEEFERDLKDPKQRQYWEMFEDELQRAKRRVEEFDQAIKDIRGERTDMIDIVRDHREFQNELAKKKSSAKNKRSGRPGSVDKNPKSQLPPCSRKTT